MMLLALLALAAADPEPGEVKIFGDWAVACDNAHACEMTALYPEDNPAPDEESGYIAGISVARAAGPAGGYTIDIDSGVEIGGPAELRIDGKTIASGMPQGEAVRFTGDDADRIVAAMVNGSDMALVDRSGKRLSRATLNGSSASLRFIDDDQGRVGTVTAAVARGDRPAISVPPAAPLPVVLTIAPAGKPEVVPKAMRAAMEKASDCDGLYDGADTVPKVERYALGGGKTLALVPCGAGAYNFSTVPFIVSRGVWALAGFDHSPGEASSDTVAMLVNARWDAKTGTLSSYVKGRGLGDCGGGEDYVWDGARFRLIAARAMPDCRGSINWLTSWRAEPVRAR